MTYFLEKKPSKVGVRMVMLPLMGNGVIFLATRPPVVSCGSCMLLDLQWFVWLWEAIRPLVVWCRCCILLDLQSFGLAVA